MVTFIAVASNIEEEAYDFEKTKQHTKHTKRPTTYKHLKVNVTLHPIFIDSATITHYVHVTSIQPLLHIDYHCGAPFWGGATSVAMHLYTTGLLQPTSYLLC